MGCVVNDLTGQDTNQVSFESESNIRVLHQASASRVERGVRRTANEDDSHYQSCSNFARISPATCLLNKGVSMHFPCNV